VTEDFTDLRTAYLLGESVVVGDLPGGTSSVLVRTARGEVFAATLRDGVASVDGLPVGTHALEARSSGDTLLGEEFLSVRARRGEDPVMGFATSFDETARADVVSWLRQLRCTVVQVYDWMERYSSPLAAPGRYHDPLGRVIERADLEGLIVAIQQLGAVAQAYAPVCAADEEFALQHPNWLLYRNDGAPQSLGSLLWIVDPANRGWQQHWIESYARALDELGFDGLHLDTYGYPRAAVDGEGVPVAMGEGYAEFIEALRAARPKELLSFNQVNGVPRGIAASSPPSFRYVEVWAPNDRWRHLEGLLARSAGGAEPRGDTLAIYPPVWSNDRDEALRTCVLTEAVVTTLGASVLLWGDDRGVLSHPYYVDHETLSHDERTAVLQWHRFSLRCRDLLRAGEDTTWYELADDNAAVTVTSDAPVSAEPTGGGLFCRVRRDNELVVVGLVDLTGSADGSWSSDTAPGTCRSAEVSVLVATPELWRAQVAVLGVDDGRFVDLSTGEGEHREGRALTCTVPLAAGWSVLRLQRDGAGS
jgi:dextranase